MWIPLELLCLCRAFLLFVTRLVSVMTLPDLHLGVCTILIRLEYINRHLKSSLMYFSEVQKSGGISTHKKREFWIGWEMRSFNTNSQFTLD